MKNLKKQYRYQVIMFFISMMIMMVDSASAHNHRHHHVNWGVSFGGGGYYPGYYGSGMYGPGVWSPGFYGYRSYGYGNPFFMSPPVYVVPPPVITSVRPPVYIQKQESQPPQPTQPRAGYWYYCQNPAGYYPTVRSCAQGWIPVPPQPPELQ